MICRLRCTFGNPGGIQYFPPKICPTETSGAGWSSEKPVEIRCSQTCAARRTTPSRGSSGRTVHSLSRLSIGGSRAFSVLLFAGASFTPCILIHMAARGDGSGSLPGPGQPLLWPRFDVDAAALVHQVTQMSLLGLQSSDSGLRIVTNPSESPRTKGRLLKS
eukprot:COSAG02_NODE_2869_length_7863_cov_5.126610_3_plen_162_part_00